MSSSSSGQRFADYFVVSGLDLVTGLEADQLSGLWKFSMRFYLAVTLCHVCRITTADVICCFTL